VGAINVCTPRTQHPQGKSNVFQRRGSYPRLLVRAPSWPCGCSAKRKVPHAPSPKPKAMDANSSGVPGAEPLAAELANVPGQRLAPQNLALHSESGGLQPHYSVKSSQPESSEQDEAAEKEKSVADRIRQQRDSKDPARQELLVCVLPRTRLRARQAPSAKRNDSRSQTTRTNTLL
jgi:hypothetical protein